MDMYGVIYLIRNLINNKLYIGQTIEKGGFDRRYRNNLVGYTHNDHLKNSIQKYGIENFEIVKEFDVAYSKEELDKLEDMYIKIYDTNNHKYGYNKQFGGANGKPSQETCELMSKSAKIRSIKYGSNFKGRNYTEETKMFLAKIHTGIKQSEQTINKRVIKNTGKFRNEEQKQRIKNSALDSWKNDTKRKDNIQRKMTTYWKGNSSRKEKLAERTAIPVYCATTGEIFSSGVEASKKYSISNSAIGKCCKGEIRYCGNLEDGRKLIWIYYKDVNNIKDINNVNFYDIPYHKNQYGEKVINLNTMEIFNSIKDASKIYKGDIGACCSGRCKSAGKHPVTKEKLVWQYYSEYIKSNPIPTAI